MPTKIAQFSEQAGQRIKTVVQLVERTPIFSPGMLGQNYPNLPGVVAKTITSFAGRTGTLDAPVFGTGKIQPYRPEGEDFALLEDEEDGLDALNAAAGAIGSGIVVLAVPLGGTYFIVKAGGGGLIWARTGGGGITARTGTTTITPGSGAVTLFDPTATGYTLGSTNVTAYNMATDTVAGLTIVGLSEDNAGRLFVVWEDCP
jgi:hypothetical protein